MRASVTPLSKADHKRKSSATSIPWLSRAAVFWAANSGDVEHDIADNVTALDDVAGFGDSLEWQSLGDGVDKPGKPCCRD
jgi:hypothetical protein